MKSLVIKRRKPISGTIEAGYTRNFKKLGDFYNGLYDFDDHVVPYSKSAGNLEAEVMFVGQDWASEDFLNQENPDMVQYEKGHDPRLPYNKLFFRILEDFFNIKFKDTYSTDAFVFIKPGNMGTKIHHHDMYLSAREYVMPQIDIIKPKTVICIGGSTHTALRKIFGLPYKAVKSSLDDEPIVYNKTKIIVGTHLGARATSSLGGLTEQMRIWENIAIRCKKF